MAKHENNGKCQKCQDFLYAGVCEPTLRAWFEKLQVEQPDVHVAYCYRDKKEQNALFNATPKKTKAKFGQSPHNYKPALALDIFFLVKGQYNLDTKRLQSIASKLPDGLMWGADWNRNGRIDDESFIDMPHFQRVDWKKYAKNYPNGND